MNTFTFYMVIIKRTPLGQLVNMQFEYIKRPLPAAL